MASIKNFKKGISAVSEYWIGTILLSKAALKNENVDQINLLIGSIFDFEADMRKKADHYDAKDNRKLVKAYFKKIYSEINAKSKEFTDKINELNK